MERIDPDPNPTNEPPPTSAPLGLYLRAIVSGVQDEIAGPPESSVNNHQSEAISGATVVSGVQDEIASPPESSVNNHQSEAISGATTELDDLKLTGLPNQQTGGRSTLGQSNKNVLSDAADSRPTNVTQDGPQSTISTNLQLVPQVDRSSLPSVHQRRGHGAAGTSSQFDYRLPCSQKPLSSGFGSADEPVITPLHHSVVPQTTAGNQSMASHYGPFVFGYLERLPPSVPRHPRFFPIAHNEPMPPPRPLPQYCKLCGLDLTIEPLWSSLPTPNHRGVMQFPCGHRYHMSCLRPAGRPIVPLPFHCCLYFFVQSRQYFDRM